MQACIPGGNRGPPPSGETNQDRPDGGEGRPSPETDEFWRRGGEPPPSRDDPKSGRRDPPMPYLTLTNLHLEWVGRPKMARSSYRDLKYLD